ncbi:MULTISPECIES: hypothetical protein [Streptomyces]|uniref:Transposase n=1 Tax=Streptomyces flaveolus TaxID=67297 RepID=A0ABV3AFZ5_9ACTN|nr:MULTISPECIES: hypothetical protein [Streptomyces]
MRRHSARTVRVAGRKRGSGWTRPRMRSDDHTSRAWVPPYQPTRKAETRNDDAVVETYRPHSSPGVTLTRSA